MGEDPDGARLKYRPQRRRLVMDRSLPPSTPDDEQTKRIEDLILEALEADDRLEAARVARIRALRSAPYAPPAVSTDPRR